MAWFTRPSYWQLQPMALDQRTTFRLVLILIHTILLSACLQKSCYCEESLNFLFHLFCSFKGVDHGELGVLTHENIWGIRVCLTHLKYHILSFKTVVGKWTKQIKLGVTVACCVCNNTIYVFFYLGFQLFEFLSRDAMRQRGLCCRPVSVLPTVLPVSATNQILRRISLVF